MNLSFAYLIAHGVLSALLWWLMVRWAIPKGWASLSTGLFFFSPLAVYLIWGPDHRLIAYAVAWLGCLVIAKKLGPFYIFLKTQELLVRYLFWVGVVVLGVGVVLMSASEINLRWNPLEYWKHEAMARPTAPVLTYLAEAYVRNKEWAKAQESFMKAKQKDPTSIRALAGIARLASQSSSWAQAIDAYQEMLKLSPGDEEAYLGLGQAYMALGRTKESIEAYSMVLKLYPDEERLYVHVVQAYGYAIEHAPGEMVYQEKREEVLADLEQLSKRKKYSAMDYYNLAFLYEQVGGKDEAMRFYTKALQLQPTHPEALYNLANLQQESGNAKVAIALYERLVHGQPKFAMGYFKMGEALAALGDIPKAKQLFLKATSIDPDNGSAYFGLGYLSEAQGELRDAINYYEKSIEVDSHNAEVYYNLGNVYATLGQTGEAIALYLKTIGLDEKHQNAFVNLSILSFKSRDFDGAIRYLEKATNLGYNPPVEYVRSLEPYRKN